MKEGDVKCKMQKRDSKKCASLTFHINTFHRLHSASTCYQNINGNQIMETDI